MMSMSRAWISVVLIFGGGIMVPVAAGGEPYPFDLAWSRRTIAYSERAAVRPDGRSIAFGVVTPAKHRDDLFTTPTGAPGYLVGTRLRAVDVGSGAETVLGPEGSISFAPSWAPDGSALAYYSDEGGELGLWLFDPSTGARRRAAPDRLKVHRYSTVPMPPEWSPDGATLLVPALPNDERGTDPVISTTGTRRSLPSAGPRVTVFAAGDEPSPPPPAVEGSARPFLGQSAVDIATIDVATGRSRVVLPAHPSGRLGPVAARYSPSGRFLAVTSARHPIATPRDAKDSLSIGVVPVGAADPAFLEVVPRLYDGRETWSGDNLGRAGVILGWHPTRDVLFFLNDYRLRRVDCTGPGAPKVDSLGADLGRLNGDYLAVDEAGDRVVVGLFPDDATGPDDHRATGLAAISLGGGPARRLELPGSASRGQVIRRAGLALWQPVPGTLTISAPGVGGIGTLFRRLDLDSGRWEDVHADPLAVRVHGMPRDGSFLIGEAESYTQAPDFHRIAPDLTVGRRIGAVEPRLDGLDLGSAATFETIVPLPDGRLGPVRSGVLLPPGTKRGDRPPALVHIYGGGGTAGDARRFGGDAVATMPAAIFTTRGYAVLLVDAPLGPEGKPNDVIEQLRAAVLPQVEHAAELGYLDLGRTALIGQSFGGYCTAGLITSTHLFRAAVAVSGFYDPAAAFGNLAGDGDSFPAEYFETGQGRMGQPPWSDLRRYLDNSPYHRADRIRTPLLLIHGQEDYSCRVHEAEQMFGALRRLGRTVQLAVYQGEGHVVEEWEPAHATDAARRILDFLGRHLGPR